MLPSLRIILAAVIAACAAVLTLSAGLVGARDPARNITGVPDLSRTLMRQAIVEEPEGQQSQLLAYSSRRADELLRLRDLPVTPVRAVVEYAEQAQARAAEAASTPAAPAAAASQDGAVVVATAPAATASADAAREPAADGAAVVAPSPTDSSSQPPSPTAAIEPVANPPSDTTAATAVAAAPVATPPSATASVSAPASLPVAEAPPVAAPADTTAVAATPAPATAAPAAAPAGGDTQVAAIQTGGSETAEMYGPVRPAAAKPHRGGKTVHVRPAKPKKKPQVARPPRNVAPATSTGFQVDQQGNRPNDAFGNWRRSSNESTTRGNTFPPPPKPRG